MAVNGLAPYIWVVWDLLAAFIIFRCVKVCAGRGVVSTLVGFSGYVVAAVAAGYTHKRIAAYLYDNVVKDMVLHSLTRSFNLKATGAGGELGDILAAIPLALRLLMPAQGSAAADLAAVQDYAGGEAYAETLAAQIIDAVLKEPLITVLGAVSFLLVFSLAAFFMRTLTRALTGVNAIPVIGGVNAALGGIFGLLVAALALYVGAFILLLVTTFSGLSLWWLNSEVINSTYIWSVFY